MTSQQLGDLALEEHRAVMAALIRNEINRPTEDQYEHELNLLREEFGRCVIFTSDLSPSVSAAL